MLARVTALLHANEIVHLCRREDWQQAQARGTYQAASLASEGFIHSSTWQQVTDTANRYFQGMSSLALLVIHPRRLQAELRWEDAGHGTFPHIYGPLNLDAVLRIIDFNPEPDGTFNRPELHEGLS